MPVLPRSRTQSAPTFRCVMFAALLLTLSAGAAAEPFRFALLSDSQRGSSSNPGNFGVSDRILSEVATRLALEEIDFVIVPGDLVEGVPVAFSRDGVREQYAYWRQVMAPVYNAGIAVYPVRGNHEGYAGPYDAESAFKLEFPELPQNGPSGRVGLTYYFDHGNARFVGIDMYDGFAGLSMNVSQSWLDSVANTNPNPHMFVYAHEPMYGRNHDDALTGSERDNFLSAIRFGGGRFYLCGHDHQHSRTAIIDSAGNFIVEQVIAAPAGEKYYSYDPPTDPRDIEVVHQGDRCGYYLFTVDGPHVSVDFVSSPRPASSGPAVFDWSITDRYTYSANGQQFAVPANASYFGLSDAVPAVDLFLGTTATLVDGTNRIGGNETVAFGWRSLNEVPNSPNLPLMSDALWLRGMRDALSNAPADTYAISMTLTGAPVGQMPQLLTLVGDQWLTAASQSVAGAANYISGPCVPGRPLGTHGYDAQTNTVWAVVDFDGIFAGADSSGAAQLGDMNCDGVINSGDIDPFVTALLDPAGYADLFPDCDRSRGDLDQSGNVDTADIDPFVDLLLS